MKFKNQIKCRMLVYILVSAVMLSSATIAMAADKLPDVLASNAEAAEKWSEYSNDATRKNYYCICQDTTAKKAACIHLLTNQTIIGSDEVSTSEGESNSNAATFNTNNIAACSTFRDSNIAYVTLPYLASQRRHPNMTNLWIVDEVVKIESSNLNSGEKVRFSQCVAAGSEDVNSCTTPINTMIDQLEFAQNPKVKPLPPTTPKLETQLPGLTLSTVANEGVGTLNLPWIAEYVAALYKYGVTVASILAVVLIILQGAKIIISGGGEQKAAAYKTIARVIIGLIIAWSSYAILYTINPNLVNLKTLQIQQIQPETIEANAVVAEGNDNNEHSPTMPGGTCLTKNNGVPIKSLNLKNIDLAAIVSLPYLTQDAAEGLKKVDAAVTTYNAANAANGGRQIRLLITSAARTDMAQNLAWETALKNAGGDANKVTGVSRPSCNGPHTSGHAIDITISGSKISSQMGERTCGSSKYARCAWDVQPVEDLQLLSQIMTGAGWQRLCLEWWHYEYPQGFLKEYGCRTTQPGACKGRCN